MKRIAFASSVVVLFLLIVIQAQTPAQTKTGSVEQELIKLEKDWNDSYIKHDWAFLDQILSDDYIGTHSDGTVFTKAQEIAHMKSNESVIASITSDDFKVRVYGDVAVITFRFTTKEQNKGKDTSGQYRTTDTWVKHEGRWQCVAGHNSEIAQK